MNNNNISMQAPHTYIVIVQIIGHNTTLYTLDTVSDMLWGWVDWQSYYMKLNGSVQTSSFIWGSHCELLQLRPTVHKSEYLFLRKLLALTKDS